MRLFLVGDGYVHAINTCNKNGKLEHDGNSCQSLQYKILIIRNDTGKGIKGTA